jgi:hypothetical protein
MLVATARRGNRKRGRGRLDGPDLPLSARPFRAVGRTIALDAATVPAI